MKHYNLLKDALSNIDVSVALQTQKGSFTVSPVFKDGYLIGVEVSNLGSDSFIPMEVFSVAISLLYLSENNTAINGNVTFKGSRLGDEKIPLNSIEGHVARVVYGKEVGISVFRRITPISKILEWADVCEIGKGCLKLK